MNAPRRKTLCIDFDGVLHGYESGWKGADVIPDRPVPGAMAWLEKALHDPGLRVVIYSSRSKESGGTEAMKAWLAREGIGADLPLEFAHEKPAAFLTLDDRAWCFEGQFPDLDQIHAFRTWQQR